MDYTSKDFYVPTINFFESGNILTGSCNGMNYKVTPKSNDEGKLLGLPRNRALTDDHGVPYDIVCGTFFVAGLKEDDFASLTEQQIEKYKDKYSNEMILSVPKQPEAHKKPMKKEKHEYER